MSPSILDQIPAHILRMLQIHLATIEHFNTDVLCMRDLERRVGSPGRYEYDVRLARQAQAEASIAWLERFAAQAATLGIAAQDVYAALAQDPTLLPWSDAALEWRR